MNQHDRKPDWVYWFVGICGLILFAYFSTPSAQAADDDDVDEHAYNSVWSIYNMSQTPGSEKFALGYIAATRDMMVEWSIKANDIDGDWSIHVWDTCQDRGVWQVENIVLALSELEMSYEHIELHHWFAEYVFDTCPEWNELIHMTDEGEPT